MYGKTMLSFVRLTKLSVKVAVPFKIYILKFLSLVTSVSLLNLLYISQVARALRMAFTKLSGTQYCPEAPYPQSLFKSTC